MVQWDKYATRKITSIAHIADVHIRLYKRHEEYKVVFSRLFEDLKNWRFNQPPDGCLIVLLGDVVHAKTDMSPEMISLASDFLGNLADIAPTVVLTGNHDMNVANPHRLDALSPLIENINHPHLHYLKNSGTYKFGNVGMGVYSIIGEKTEWPEFDDVDGEVKVALYHGPVFNAKTDTGYVITNRHVELRCFDGYDLTLLGDIHRHQIMQWYAPTLKKPAVAYAGSLIQQNHGESLGSHGWIEWDISTKTPTLHEVENDYGYATIIVDSPTLQIPPLPKNVRLRLFTENVDAAGIKKIISIIRKNNNISELTINKVSPGTRVFDATSAINHLDVHDVVYQNKLIKEYIEQNYPNVSSEVLEKIFEINVQLNSRVQEEELPRNIHWRPVHLKFDNLFSYGKGNEIKFDGMQGLYGVFSPNATGKTSAFDALCFALYDKTPRAFKGSHIMNSREDECFCEFEFEVGQDRYKILRRGSRRKNGEVKVDVEFMRYEQSEWRILSGEDRRDTNAIIRSYVGDYEDFVLTNLSVQNQNALFIDKGQSERKDLLSQFMGLTIFDRMFMLASDDIKEVAGSLKQFNKEDFTRVLVEIQEEIEQLGAEHIELNEKVSYYKQAIENLNEQIVHKTGQKMFVEIQDIDEDGIRRRIDKLKKQLSGEQQTYQILESALEQLQQTLYELQQKIPNIIEVEGNYFLYQSLEKQRNELEQETKLIKMKLVEYQKKIDWLAKHEYDPNCKYCVNNVFVKDAQQAVREHAEQSDVLRHVNEKSLDLVSKIRALENSVEQYDDYQKLLQSINQLEKDKLRKEVDVQKTKTIVSNLDAELNRNLEMIRQYEAMKETILTNKKIDEEIQQLKKDVVEQSTELRTYEEKSKLSHGRIEVLKSKREELLNRIKEAGELESTYEAYEYYLTAICRDGIPYQLISDVIPTIQSSVNNILSHMVDFTVSLEVDGKNINGKIVYDDTRSWPLELSSGMEKFVSGLAIRVALMSISSLPRSNFLIIDEGLGVLDSENLSSMFLLFDVLKNEFEFIILISHLDIVRDIADNLIEIRRENEYSYINVN